MRFVSVELPTYEEKLKKCKSAVTWCRVCRETACCRTQSNYLPTRQLKKFKSAVTWWAAKRRFVEVRLTTRKRTQEMQVGRNL